MRHGWLIAALVLVCAPALASTAPPQKAEGHLCRTGNRNQNAMWEWGQFDAPVAAQYTVVDASEGRTADVRHDMAMLSAAQRVRWGSTALDIAVSGNHPATVAALLAAGADPDKRGWIPPLKPAVYQNRLRNIESPAYYQTILKSLEMNPHFRDHAKQLAKIMQRSAEDAGNHGSHLQPPLFLAVQCHRDAVAKVLIDHGASVRMRQFLPHGQRGVDLLTIAVVTNDANITRLLLDHGANACADDRSMAQAARRFPLFPMHTRAGISRKGVHRMPVHTLTGIARKDGMPPDLVARLQCRAP